LQQLLEIGFAFFCRFEDDNLPVIEAGRLFENRPAK